MKTLFKAAAGAALVAPAAIFMVAPAMAQAVPGLAVADLNEAVQKSNAYAAAMTQIQTTYKPQIDQANARRTAIQAELKPLADAFDAASKVPNANQATLRTQADAIQKKEQAGQQELNRIIQPVALAQAYVNEQIVAQLEPALDRVMAKKKISVVLTPDSTVKSLPAAQITTDVVAELNTALPAVQIVPPAGWLPESVRRQQGQQGAPQPQQAQPQGR